MRKYQVIEEHLTDPELGSYTTYGICLDGGEGEKPEQVISDVSLSRQAVEELAARCSRLELDPIHLRDVAEDAVQVWNS